MTCKSSLLVLDAGTFRDCIVTKFLTLCDVARLDIAITNKTIRSQVREVASWDVALNDIVATLCPLRLFHELRWSGDLITVRNDKFAVWLIGRGVKSCNVLMPPNISSSIHFSRLLKALLLKENSSKCQVHLSSLNLSALVGLETMTHLAIVSIDNKLDLENSAYQILQHSNIEKLSIYQSELLFGDCMMIPTVCSLSLQSLLLKDCHNLRSGVLGDFATNFPMLTELALIAAKDLPFQKLAQCGLLTRLNLALTSVSDSDIISIASSCRLLIYLNVNCSTVTDTGIAAVAEKCSVLEELDCGCCAHMSSQSLSALALGCRKMVVLYASFNAFLQDLNTPEINYKALTVLNLDHCALGDRVLIQLLWSVPLLQQLYLMGTGITDAALQPLASLEHLRTVNVSFCKKLTADCIEAILYPGNGLQELVIRESPPLTSAVIAHICELGGRLQVLDMRCHNLQPADVEVIATKLPFLRELVCANKITTKLMTGLRARRPLVRLWSSDRRKSWPLHHDL